MYIPKLFKNENIDEVREFIKENAFGILVGNVKNKLHATHIPLVLGKNDAGNEVLTGHISKGNPQLKEISLSDEVMVIFQGPHSYISSSWYDHENVPTWNYLAVHVYGFVRIVEGNELLTSLKSLVDKYEANSKNPVTTEAMNEKFLSNELKGITGFEIKITSIEAAYKLSQNRDSKNYSAIINELENKSDFNSKAIADEMKKILDRKK